jgi:hypothetical protein
MRRWEKLFSATSLICKLGIIATTFIFLRNEIAWQEWLKDAGSSGGSRDKMTMLIGSLAATACVIFLSIIGHGDITTGVKNAFGFVRAICRIATSTSPVMLPHWKIFKTLIHPVDKDAGHKPAEQAPAEQLHDMNSTSAATSK